MSAIHEEQKISVDYRLYVIPATVFFGIASLFFRLWYIQVAETPMLNEEVEHSQRGQGISVLAPRGIITDSKGAVIAGIRPKLVLIVQPKLALKNPEVLERVAKIIKMDKEELIARIEHEKFRGNLPIPIDSNLDVPTAAKIIENNYQSSGFSIDSQAIRSYPDTITYSSILGHVWTPTEAIMKELKNQGLSPAQLVGRDGIERKYEKLLMGKPGEDSVVYDSKRKPLYITERESSIPGAKVVLSVNTSLQKTAIQQLSGRRGAIVAIDPNNGEILALVSAPGFDAEPFTRGISSDEWKLLRDDPGKPMFNRAVSGSYMPGSTFKLATSIAAKLARKFDPHRTYYCNGFVPLGGKKNPKCMGTHGSIEFNRALVKSCNAYFGLLARDVGMKKMYEMTELLGFGKRSGIDIPGESKGIFPTPEQFGAKDWRIGSTAQIGFGQSMIDATPLQMANLMATIASNGVRYQPHFVRAVQGFKDKTPKPVQPKVLARLKFEPEFWDTLKRACLGVVQSGTARGAAISGFDYGGKTGSAERKGQKVTNSWYVCFAPYDKPKIAIAILVEEAGHGGDVAAPIGRALIENYCLSKGDPPKSSTSDSKSETLPKSPLER